MDRCRLLVLGAGDITLRFVQRCLSLQSICLVGVIPDSAVDREYLTSFENRLGELGVPVMELTEHDIAKADIVFSPNYRRIVPPEMVKNHLIINCHGGILPKYRGFAANAWAIMNGESEIGYSIHRMNEYLDDGEIYFVKHIPIAPTQTYSDVHDQMLGSIVNEVPELLVRIWKNEIRGVPQTGERVYCTRFSASMGNLKNFAVPAAYLVNLYRCMAGPLGTGVYFFYKGTRYNVQRVEHGRDYQISDYLCQSGKVVNMEKNALWVKTSDNLVRLSGITTEEGAPVVLQSIFRNGCRLGSEDC